MNTDQPAVQSQAPASKRTKRKKVLATRKDREGFAHYILQTVDFSKQSGEVSLGVIRKELAAAGVNVKKNKARIKAGLRKLVAMNILLKVPGSYRLIGETTLPPQLVNQAKSPKKREAENIKKGKKVKKKGKKPEEPGEQIEESGDTATSSVCFMQWETSPEGKS
nr:histone H1.1-like [Pelodiscus sinensis]|eukprot:XP_006136032.1 histone H1.1-like [Pelodiscus sinensis]